MFDQQIQRQISAFLALVYDFAEPGQNIFHLLSLDLLPSSVWLASSRP
jgi:hypothetical protein